MSRALDSGTKASLRSGDPTAAYQAISDVLMSSRDGLLEIEILGPTHLGAGQYVVRDGSAVGIPKIGLVKAFLVARKHLRDHLDGATPLTEDAVLAATAVILLLDPEYLTAANSRKRLIQRQLSLDGDAHSRLQRERRFVDSLLTSRLHRHTKSPTLWSHRRWLLGEFQKFGMPVDALGDITTVVFVAGERHPRNYYAWCHARLLVSLDKRPNDQEILAAVKTWCFQHHTDISGWSFLHFLLRLDDGRDTEAACSIFDEVLKLVSSLSLANESVWVFLRTLAASGLVGDKQFAQLVDIQQSLLGTLNTLTDQAVLQAAVDWCQTYRYRT
ncbi:protein prenylyltransferase [Canariomyces notabilis]|uniref:Protein prenylyltransferase n=1 Tax=Canariomyces notabilis TaxID=2074819 RepID=A0AAN6T7J1_9PEZI|nr:protein prenylyltransferase [Canariomyces arenarius]